jgi:hypothetical protein
MSEDNQFPDVIVPTLGRKYSHTPSLHEHDVGFTWNETHEKLLKQWGERSQYYSIMHDRAGKHYATLNKWIGLPCKIILVLIGSVEFSQTNKQEDSTWSPYLTGFAAILGLVINLSQDFLGFGDRATKHFLSAVAFDKLHLDVSMELTHPKDKRTNVRSYMRSIRRNLCDIKDTSPDIPIRILDNYMKEIDKTVLLPTEIVIHKEDVQSQPLPQIQSQPLNLSQSQPSPNDNVDDIQDEFAKEMERRLDALKSKSNEHQLSRLNS